MSLIKVGEQHYHYTPEDDCQIYVGKYFINSGLYICKTISLFHDMKGWMAASRPNTEEVIKEFWKCNELNSRWTDDINRADRWRDYDIEEWRKYLPFVNWSKAYPHVVDSNGNEIR